MVPPVQYAILIAPSANRVYGLDAPRLAAAELAVIAPTLRCQPHGWTTTALGGVEYLTFSGGDLDDHDRVALSNLSATYALFSMGDGPAPALTPLLVEPAARFGADLITIQRYSGKTNEQFTHLLVNVATAVSTAAQERRQQHLPVRLIDPVAGRGTTLNRGLVYGFDVAGLDSDSSDFDAYRTFLTTYLKN
ncbi:MAG: modification methylase, partial [Acidimicrobiia bacterium]|nr:modification methylase [Acidimicrobiia bacterium]